MLIRGVLIGQLKRRKLRRIGCGRRERCAHEVDAAVNALLERRSIRAELVFKARDDLYRAAAFLFDQRTEPLARLIGEVVRALAARKGGNSGFLSSPRRVRSRRAAGAAGAPARAEGCYSSFHLLL